MPIRRHLLAAIPSLNRAAVGPGIDVAHTADAPALVWTTSACSSRSALADFGPQKILRAVDVSASNWALAKPLGVVASRAPAIHTGPRRAPTHRTQSEGWCGSAARSTLDSKCHAGAD